MLEDNDIDHGNIKLSNLFVEYIDTNVNNVSRKHPVIVVSDRNIIGKSKPDPKMFANIMH